MSCISVKDKKRLKEKRVTFSHPLTKTRNIYIRTNLLIQINLDTTTFVLREHF